MNETESTEAGGQPGESGKERIDRELIELLNELRVALPGVQVLFAFLLVVPFQQRFATVTEFQKTVYFVTLLLAAASSAFLIAPSAYHRLLFRAREKSHMLRTANLLMIIGLGLLAAAIVGTLLLITDFLYGSQTTAVVTGVAAVLFALLWFVLPAGRRLRGGVAPEDEL